MHEHPPGANDNKIRAPEQRSVAPANDNEAKARGTVFPWSPDEEPYQFNRDDVAVMRIFFPISLVNESNQRRVTFMTEQFRSSSNSVLIDQFSELVKMIHFVTDEKPTLEPDSLAVMLALLIELEQRVSDGRL